MPAYRFYTIQQTGHVTTAPIVHVLPDDDAATREVQRIVTEASADIEIWKDGRLVAYVVPDAA